MIVPIQKRLKLSMSIAVAGLLSFALFSGIHLWATPVAYAAGETCFVETTGDANTDYSSADASALRQAIADASPGDTLKIAGICAGVDDSTLLNGEYAVINLTKALTLTGGYTTTAWLDSPNPTSNPTTLDGMGEGRVVRIVNVVVTLENLQITRGANLTTTTDGGGFYIAGNIADVTIRNSRIFSNSTQHFGAGFYIVGSDVTLEASQVFSNTAGDRGGALTHENSGTTILDGSEISHNQAVNNGGGIANNQQVTFLITDSVISNNVTQNQNGGGLWLINGGYAELVNSTVISNSSGNFGGGLFNDLNSTMVLTNTIVRDNQAVSRGGGINNDGVMFIHNSTVVTNTVTTVNGNGGGFYLGNKNAVITQTGTITVAYNQTAGNGQGGGFFVADGRLNLNSARILSNFAGNNGGAILQNINADQVTIINSCIVNNDVNAIFNANGPNIDATANWWGASDGPSGDGPGNGDSIDSLSGTIDIDTSGFLTNAVLNCPTVQRAIVVNTDGTGSGTVDRDPDQATYDLGSVVTLTANADIGSTFIGWSGDITSTAATVMVTLTADITVTASFTLTQHALTVTTTGTGSGGVTSSPAGIDCGNDCTEIYDFGTVVTLTANADTGSSFSGWSGACTNPTGDCVVTIDSAKDATANFTLKQYDLSVATSGVGSVSSTPAGISCGGDCTENYDHGTVVTLVASADLGSAFSGWSGACSNTSGDCVVTMDSAKSVTANFVFVQYALLVTTEGAGSGSVSSDPAGIDCGVDCTAFYTFGSVVTLHANADPGSSFGGWSGDLIGMDNPTAIIIDSSKTVTAIFVTEPVITYTLTTHVVGSGVITPSGGTFPAGSAISVTATADNGWTFAGWLGDLISTDNPASLTLDANKFITATFVTSTVATTLTLEITPENPQAEEPITLTATVLVSTSVSTANAADVSDCAVTGEVTFFANNNSLGEVSLNDECQAILTLNDGLPAANYTFSATYAGSGGFLPATSTVTLSVSEPEASQIFLPRLHR